MKNSYKIMILILVIAIIGLILFTFSNNKETGTTTVNTNTTTSSSTSSSSSTSTSSSSTTVTVNGAIYKKADEFSERDLAGTYDESASTKYTLADNTDITIKEEGVYVVSGSAKNVTINVEALDTSKVQIVLDNASITNETSPAIYVKTGDKVFVTLVGDNTLKVTGTFKADSDNNLDGVIFSKQDITLNGSGTLNIESTDNGIVGKDDLKITGGTYNIKATTKCLEANDSIRIAGGTFNLTAGTDGLHSENDDDNSKGYIYITSGEFNIKAGDDAVHATTVVQIDDGTLNITAAEGIEGTYIQINNGTITINASDDGINAAKKSTSYTPTVEINNGNIKITMGQGDTDGIDSNGNIIMNGGTVDITGQFTTDYDGTATKNGGTLIVNGSETDTFPNQFGGGMPGGQMQGGRRGF